MSAFFVQRPCNDALATVEDEPLAAQDGAGNVPESLARFQLPTLKFEARRSCKD